MQGAAGSAREVRRETVSNGSRSPMGKSYRQNCVQGMGGNWIVLILSCGQGQEKGTDKGMGDLRTKQPPQAGSWESGNDRQERCHGW